MSRTKHHRDRRRIGWDDLYYDALEETVAWRAARRRGDGPWSGELEYRDTITWRRGGAGALDYTCARAVAAAIEDARHTPLRTGWRSSHRAFWKYMRDRDIKELEGDVGLFGQNPPVIRRSRDPFGTIVKAAPTPGFYLLTDAEIAALRARFAKGWDGSGRTAGGRKACEFDDEAVSVAAWNHANARWAAA